MLQLSNEHLQISFHKKGAELCSIKDQSGTEFIWQADPTVWARHAPILFPIVGRLKNNSYSINGKVYELTQHGFARDMEFDVISQTANTIAFELVSTEKTLEKYPFQFKLQIKYQLEEKCLSIIYKVQNIDSSNIYFSIGGHPGFTCPLNEGEKRSDYSLLFSENETSKTHLLDDGLFNGKVENVFSTSNLIPITESLFDNDAIVFKDLKSETISLINAQGEKRISVHFKDFPYLGIWSKNRTAPFICIEPWLGIADYTTHNGDFIEKAGTQCIKSNQHFEASYTIEIH